MKERKKNLKRSAHSGKIINGREAILSDEAVDYVKTLGFKVIPLQMEHYLKALVVVFLVMGALILFPSVSAETNTTEFISENFFHIDLTENFNIAILLSLFAMAGLMFYFKQMIFVSLLMLINGFTILFSGSTLFGVVVIVLGVYSAFLKGGNE